jgi:antitoxin ParD1/3/4
VTEISDPAEVDEPVLEYRRGCRSSRIESYSSMAESVMRTTRQLSITLPNDMADAVRERVRAGEYASESEVIREGLRALWARDQAVEAWLRNEVAEAYDNLAADPARGVPAEELRRRLAAKRASAT